MLPFLSSTTVRLALSRTRFVSPVSARLRAGVDVCAMDSDVDLAGLTAPQPASLPAGLVWAGDVEVLGYHRF